MIQYGDKTYRSEVEQALDIGHALLWRKYQGPWRTLENLDYEEDRASLDLWIIERMRSYDQARGAVSTLVYHMFRQWAWVRVQERIDLWENEAPFPQVTDEGTHQLTIFDLAGSQVEDTPTPAEFSERANEIVDMFPEKVREAVRLCLADGLENAPAAELIGVTRRTVERHVKEAREHIPQIAAALEAA